MVSIFPAVRFESVTTIRFKKTLVISDAHYVNCSSEFYPHIGNTNEGTSNFCHNVMIAIQNKLFQEFTKVLNIVYLYKTGHM